MISSKSKYILAIESSCDETSASVVLNGRALTNIISSQHFHSKYGGVIPELASRAHLKAINEVTEQALSQSGLTINDISAIAVTSEPGLIGSLIVGTNFAKGLAISYNLPVIPVNHIEGHLFSGFLDDNPAAFPFTALVVSGGHTVLFHVESFDTYSVIGSTIDDAAGEAFDKIAIMLGLGYPGGPHIDRLAAKGDEKKYEFPRSMINSHDFDFSFSGLKTSVKYFLAKNFPGGVPDTELANICASAQAAITDVLAVKTMNASKEYRTDTIVVSGGVSANSRLRNLMLDHGQKFGKNVLIPRIGYCMDNAAMIGFVAEKKFEASSVHNYDKLSFTVSSNSIRSPRKKK